MIQDTWLIKWEGFHAKRKETNKQQEQQHIIAYIDITVIVIKQKPVGYFVCTYCTV